MWNPDQYLRFAQERTRPARDLCARVPLSAPARILDAGCGPGNSTEVLGERWPGAHLTGLDSDPAMLAKARAMNPEGVWILGDLAEFQAPPFDLVFSNAVLQWLPDHAQLLPRLMALVAPGGCLAFQIPSNPRSPIRDAMARAARDPAFGAALEGAGDTLTFHDARFYYEGLAPLAAEVDLWETTYVHVLPGHQALVDWMESTGMRPYLARLADPEAQARFKGIVLELCRTAYPASPDGKVLMPFERLFCLVTK
jgi:trans-aconitate 2-methyltransferase